MTTPEHRGRIIDAEVVASVPPLDAWQAWADPEKLAGWFVDRAEGAGRTGEIMTWIFDRFGVRMPYRVLESVPGERIVFGPASDDAPPFILEVTMTRAGGETRIRVVNSGFSEDADFDAQFEGMDSGWRMALGVLREYLERHFGQTKRVFMAMRPTEATAHDLMASYTDSVRLARWFGTARGDVGPVGSAVDIGLLDGGTLTGRVLARTGTEIALGWSEIDGVCELKSFSQGPVRMMCIRGLGWELDKARASELESRLTGVLERLAAEIARPL